METVGLTTRQALEKLKMPVKKQTLRRPIGECAISACETSQKCGVLGSFLVSKNTGFQSHPCLPANLRVLFSVGGDFSLNNYLNRGIFG